MNWTKEKPELKQECIVIGMREFPNCNNITYAYDFYMTKNGEWETIDTEGYNIGLDSIDYDYYMVINYPEQEGGK